MKKQIKPINEHGAMANGLIKSFFASVYSAIVGNRSVIQYAQYVIALILGVAFHSVTKGTTLGKVFAVCILLVVICIGVCIHDYIKSNEKTN